MGRMPGLGVEDVRCKLDHYLGETRTRYASEQRLLIAHLVVVAEKGTEQAFAHWLDRHHMLAVGENDARESNAILVFHGIADDSERFLTGLPLRHNVVGAIEVTPIDLVQRHKLLDVERVGAL